MLENDFLLGVGSSAFQQGAYGEYGMKGIKNTLVYSTLKADRVQVRVFMNLS